MEITEKWLGGIGGWQVLANAKRMLTSVSDPTHEGDAVRGIFTEGPRKYQSGLRIRSTTDVENLCTCPLSRGRGLICAHSVAVALTFVQKPVTPVPSRYGSRSGGYAAPVKAAAPPAAQAPATAPGSFTLFFPSQVLDGSFRGQAAVFLRFQAGEGKGTPADARIAQWLKSQGLRPGSMPLTLTKNDLAALFQTLPDHPDLYEGKPAPTPDATSRLHVAASSIRLPLLATEVSGDSSVEPEVSFSLEGQDLRPLFSQATDLWCWTASSRTLCRADCPAPDVLRLISELPAARPLSWLVNHRQSLDACTQLRLEGPTLKALHLAPLPTDFVLSIDGTLSSVEVQLHAKYRQTRWLAMSGGPDQVGQGSTALKFPLQDSGQPQRFYTRNFHRENAAVQTLLDIGFQIASATTLRLAQADQVARFYASELPRLNRLFTVEESARWQGATRGLMRITPRALTPRHSEGDARRPGQDWLSLDIAYTAPDGYRIPRSEILSMIRTGRRSLSGPGGKKYIIDEESIEEFEETLRDTDSQLTADGINVRADKAQYLLGMSDEDWAQKQQASWITEDALAASLPDLAQTLRSYQVHGIRFLDAAMRGPQAALLADDMGLGKTLQTLAVIRLLKQRSPLPALIVCPKSLLSNWMAEFQRFAPDLKVTTVQGQSTARAQLLASLSQHDAVITTYQLVIRDLAHYKQQAFGLVALDEASFIKNPDTEAAKALRQLRADHRIALTGTPIENTARDLWSIFHFLLPGYLGSRDTFKERFEKPLAAGVTTPDAKKAASRLQKLIRPFFLRRTKREVLQDLPEKLEQVLYCDLSPAQLEVYKRLLEEGHAEVREARKRQGQGAARLTMFTLLLRLRQACCDLRLTGMPQESLSRLGQDDLSGKTTVWRDRITEISAAGGKVLVFSQFVKFLHLLRDELTAEQIPFAYLDGQSNDRSEQVERFQNDPSIKVFLISLKAGGYGLNLTAADHVMLMDPWWNPAVEAQAIDRAHRLGQERVVTALRFVTKGTVEEKIIKLQATKRGIIESTLTLDDEAPMMSALSDADMESLLDVGV